MCARPIVLALFFLQGCGAAGMIAQEGTALSELRLQLEDAKSAGVLSGVDGTTVTVRGNVQLKYRGQQFLMLKQPNDSESDSDVCLQLIIPDAINSTLPQRGMMVTLTGELAVLGSDEEALYEHFQVDGVAVYPFCSFAPGVFLLVKSVAM